MVTTLLGCWLRYYDPLHRGLRPAGLAGAVLLTGGYGFPRVRGGYHLRRASGRVPAGDDPVVGSAGADGQVIRTFPWITHEAGTVYQYRLFPVGGGGMESYEEVTMAVAGFDAGGRWIGPRPVAPVDLRVEPAAGGRFLLRWSCPVAAGQTEPAWFRIYDDGGSGTVNLSAPGGRVAWRPGRVEYRFLSPAFPDDLRVGWLVRSETTDGVQDDNMRLVAAVARCPRPAPAPVVLLSPAGDQEP